MAKFYGDVTLVKSEFKILVWYANYDVGRWAYTRAVSIGLFFIRHIYQIWVSVIVIWYWSFESLIKTRIYSWLYQCVGENVKREASYMRK
jgi:hypothetical protein